MGRPPFTPRGSGMMRLLIGAVTRPDDEDIDNLDFLDPHPTAEEILLAIETFTGKGIWSLGEERPLFTEKLKTMGIRKKYRGDLNQG